MTNENQNGNGTTETGNRATRRAAVSKKAAPTGKKARAKATRSNTPMPTVTKKLSRKEQVAATYADAGLTTPKELHFSTKNVVELDSAAANKAIALLRSTGASAKKLAHTTACGILMHYQRTGDWSKLTPLDIVIGEVFGGAKQRAFRAWVGTFSTVAWRDSGGVSGKGTFFDSVKGQGADEKRFNLTAVEGATKESPVADQGALNNAFWSGSFGDQPDHTYDFEKAFAAFATRIQSELERREKLVKEKQKAKANKIKVDDSQVKAVLNLAKTLHIKLESATPAGHA